MDPNDFEYSYPDCEPETFDVDLIKLVMYYDQEPFSAFALSRLFLNPEHNTVHLGVNDLCYTYGLNKSYYFESRLWIIANSEHSQEKTQTLKQLEFADWYYFFHGFAALDWYKNIRYMPPIRSYQKIFITFNNLHTEKRSYRLNLVARLFENQLDQKGYISLNSTAQSIKQEIFSTDCLLGVDAKKLVLKHLIHSPELIIDTAFQHGALSANDDLATMSLGLFHVVTETVFYESKLHLTEKIFKPIAARRPFILVAAPGNLAYLKSYGFQTFDRWIDESYDLELDPDQRIIKIITEIDRLCQLNDQELNAMYDQMQSVLEYNFNWFYNGFKQLIVEEMINNFERCLIQHNSGRDASFNNYIDYSHINFQEIKNRLAQ